MVNTGWFHFIQLVTQILNVDIFIKLAFSKVWFTFSALSVVLKAKITSLIGLLSVFLLQTVKLIFYSSVIEDASPPTCKIMWSGDYDNPNGVAMGMNMLPNLLPGCFTMDSREGYHMTYYWFYLLSWKLNWQTYFNMILWHFHLPYSNSGKWILFIRMSSTKESSQCFHRTIYIYVK